MDVAIIAIARTLLAIIGTIIFHLGALAVVTRFSHSSWHPRIHAPGVSTLVICAHLTEIAGYSLIYWISDVPLNIGWFAGEQPGLFGMSILRQRPIRRSVSLTSCRMARCA